jgi:hypothetical protein
LIYAIVAAGVWNKRCPPGGDSLEVNYDSDSDDAAVATAASKSPIGFLESDVEDDDDVSVERFNIDRGADHYS